MKRSHTNMIRLHPQRKMFGIPVLLSAIALLVFSLAPALGVQAVAEQPDGTVTTHRQDGSVVTRRPDTGAFAAGVHGDPDASRYIEERTAPDGTVTTTHTQQEPEHEPVAIAEKSEGGDADLPEAWQGDWFHSRLPADWRVSTNERRLWGARMRTQLSAGTPGCPAQWSSANLSVRLEMHAREQSHAQMEQTLQGMVKSGNWHLKPGATRPFTLGPFTGLKMSSAFEYRRGSGSPTAGYRGGRALAAGAFLATDPATGRQISGRYFASGESCWNNAGEQAATAAAQQRQAEARQIIAALKMAAEKQDSPVMPPKPKAPDTAENDEHLLKCSYCNKEVQHEPSGVGFSDLYGEVYVIPICPLCGEPDSFFAELESALYVGDKVEARANSGAILSLRDMTTFTMRPGSTIRIGDSSSPDNRLSLLMGHVWVNVRRMLDDGTMDVEMSQAIAGARGTVFSLEETGDTSIVRVMQGAVEATTKSGESHMLQKNQMIEITKDGSSGIQTFAIDDEIANWPEEARAEIKASLRPSVDPDTLLTPHDVIDLERASGRLDFDTRERYHDIQVPRHGSLRVEVEADPDLRIRLNLYDADGRLLRSSRAAPTSSSSVEREDLAPGAYRARVTRAGGEGDYRLSTQLTAPSIANDAGPNDSIEEVREYGQPIPLDRHSTGLLGYQDRNERDTDDWFRLETREHGAVEVSVDTEESLRIRLFLHDADGRLMSSSRAGSTSSRSVEREDLAAGTYFVRITRASGQGGYVLTPRFQGVSYQSDTEPNDRREDAQSIPLGENTTGLLGYVHRNVRDSEDWFQFETREQGTVKVSVDAEESLRIRLFLHDTNGRLLRSSHAGVTSSRGVERGDLPAGTYFVRITRASGQGGYTLRPKWSP